MPVAKICVLGGTGFIGSSIVTALAARRYVVRVPTRNRERVRRLLVLPTADVVGANVHDEAELERLTAGIDAVINLVGILHERKRGDFEKVHAELPAKLIAACKKNGVRRLLHMSALNAGVAGPSEYLRSKGRGEQAVMSGALHTGLDVTVFRPSVVFGREDNFLNMLAKLTRRLPIIVLGSPNARFQPVYVDDVARVFVDALDDARTFGRCYDICGPKIYTLRELVQLAARMSGKKRRVFGLGDGLSYLQAWSLEPTRIITRDNFYSMKMDNVCATPFPFSFEPSAIESVAPAYMSPKASRSR